MPTCVFVGVLDYRANVDGVTWFCQSVWPRVRAELPTATFLIVGRRPVSAVRRLAQYPGVKVIGEVPDVTRYLQQSQLVIAPLRIARGIQNKILEGLSAGKAVIASGPALEGLNLVPGEHLFQADTPDQWVTGILTLLADDRLRHRLGTAGRAFVCQHHRWDTCLRPLEKLLLAERQHPSGVGSHVSVSADPAVLPYVGTSIRVSRAES